MKVIALLLALVAVASCNLFVSVSPARNGAVTFSITNEGVEPAEFLTYGTPFDGETLFFPILNITTRDGLHVPYNGPRARFVYPPPKTATVNLPAGSTLSALLRVSEYYELPTEGDYAVSITLPRFNPTLAEARINEEPTTARLVPGTGRKQGSRADFTNCSGTKQDQIIAAANTGLTQSRNAYNCLNGRTCNDLNTRWFGTSVGSANYNYDIDTFSKVNTYLQNGINAYCDPAGCGPNVYGYVYPTDSTKTVYLCGAFWSVPNERANTIVHEESHFNNGVSLKGTDDYTYGEVSCLALAKSSPADASHNADNVCFMSAEA